MKNSPAFQMFVRDWLSDQRTRLMTVNQRGIYIDLLCFCWEGDGLPSDHKVIGKLAGLTPKEIKVDLPVVLNNFVATGDKLHHVKLIEQKKWQEVRRHKASESAGKRWRKPEDSHDSSICETDANAMRTHMPTHCEGNAIIAVAVAVADSNTDNNYLTQQKPDDWKARLEENWNYLWANFPKRVNPEFAKKLFLAEFKKPDRVKLAFFRLAIERFSDRMRKLVERDGSNEMVTRLSVWLKEKQFADGSYDDLWEEARQRVAEAEACSVGAVHVCENGQEEIALG